jgi:hypothetical protein
MMSQMNRKNFLFTFCMCWKKCDFSILLNHIIIILRPTLAWCFTVYKGIFNPLLLFPISILWGSEVKECSFQVRDENMSSQGERLARECLLLIFWFQPLRAPSSTSVDTWTACVQLPGRPLSSHFSSELPQAITCLRIPPILELLVPSLLLFSYSPTGHLCFGIFPLFRESFPRTHSSKALLSNGLIW